LILVLTSVQSATFRILVPRICTVALFFKASPFFSKALSSAGCFITPRSDHSSFFWYGFWQCFEASALRDWTVDPLYELGPCFGFAYNSSTRWADLLKTGTRHCSWWDPFSFIIILFLEELCSVVDLWGGLFWNLDWNLTLCSNINGFFSFW
jgi:hypothetical protein